MALISQEPQRIEYAGRVWQNVGYVFVKYTHSQKDKAEVYLTLAESKEQYEAGQVLTPDLDIEDVNLPNPCTDVLGVVQSELLINPLFSSFQID